MRFIEKLRRSPKQISAIVAVVAAVITIPAALLAWGPDRPTYTTAQPADHVTFNSITDNPEVGDERNFVRVKEAGAANSTYSDAVNLVPGKKYTVYMYYHNNAASNLNASGKGIAKDVSAKAEIPAIVSSKSTGTQMEGYINSSNASPKSVYDEASFNNATDGDIALRYVAGSAVNHNGGGANGAKVADSIITTGAALGYDSLNGVVPGCNQYAGYVTFDLVADQANFEVTKQVRKTGTSTWLETVKANPGESVDYLISYKNTGTTQQNNVVIKDTLPTGQTYVAGSAKLANPKNPSGVKTDDGVTTTGLNVGDYPAGSNAYLMFSAKVDAKDTLPCGPQTMTNKATVETNNGNKSDTAVVTTDGKECQPEAKYTCDSLTVQKLSDTKVKFSTAYTVENATFKDVTYVVKNAAGAEVYRGTNDTYTTTTAGAYTVQAIVTVTVNGQDKTVTSDNCVKSFTINTPEVVYRCDGLSVQKLSRTSVKFSTAYTVQNATFKSVTYVVKNAVGVEIYRGSDATYTQATVGTYTVQAFVTVTVNGEDKIVTSENCKKAFEVTTEETEIKVCELSTKTIVTIKESDFDSSKYSKNLDDCASVPTELPQTGAADVIAKISGMVALTSATMYYISSRRSV